MSAALTQVQIMLGGTVVDTLSGSDLPPAGTQDIYVEPEVDVSTIPEGSQPLSVEAMDDQGNTATRTSSYPVVVDRTPPSLQLTDPTQDLSIHTNSYPLRFTASDENFDYVECQNLTTGESYEYGDGCAPELTQGPNQLDVVAYDEAGNSTTSPIRTITVSSLPPVVLALSPGSQGSNITASTEGTNVSFPFFVTDDGTGHTTTCALDGGTAQPCASPISYTGLSIGKHEIVIVATDGGGQTSNPVRIVDTLSRYALTRLAANIVSPGRVTAGSPVALDVGLDSGEYYHPGVAPTGVVTVSEGGSPLGTISLSARDSRSSGGVLTFPAGALGSHTLTLTYAGDSHTASGYATFVYQTVAPIVPVVRRAVVTVGKVLHGKIQLHVTCPAGSAACSGSFALGKSRVRYALQSGQHTVVSLALPKPLLKLLGNRHSVSLTLLFADNVKHSALVVHLH